MLLLRWTLKRSFAYRWISMTRTVRALNSRHHC